VSDERGLRARVVDEAGQPSSPSGPARGITWLSGLVLAALVAIGAAWFADTRERRRDPSLVLARNGVPLLGEIPSIRKVRMSSLPALVARADEPLLEAIAALRTNIAILVSHRHVDTIAVVARRPGEGASTLAASLAWSMAGAGHSIALIDADLRTPGLEGLMQSHAAPDHEPRIVSARELRDAAEATWAYGSAPKGLHPVDLVGTGLPAVLRGTGHEGAELTIVDAPALLTGAESRLALALSRYTLVILDIRRRNAVLELDATLRELRDSGCVVLGVVYTHVPRLRSRLVREGQQTGPSLPAPEKPTLPGRTTAAIDG
jgi:Mrp family chromosome partitioning ATPase